MTGTAPPTADGCRDFLRQHGVPPHIQRHSEQVARVALHLADRLEKVGVEVDRALLTAGALLHDIAKADCLNSPRDHAAEGGRVLRELGLESVAEVVERHVQLGPWSREGVPSVAELLNYADKRVCHEAVVSLEERFLDLIERYGNGGPEAESRIRSNWAEMLEVESKIFAQVPEGPECLQGEREGRDRATRTHERPDSALPGPWTSKRGTG